MPGARGGRGGSGPAAASPSPAPARCPGPPLPPAPPGPRTLRSPQDSGPPPPPQPRGGLPTPTSRLPSHLGARPGRCGAETLSVAVGRDGDSGPSLPASGCGTRVPAPVPEARPGRGRGWAGDRGGPGPQVGGEMTRLGGAVGARPDSAWLRTPGSQNPVLGAGSSRARWATAPSCGLLPTVPLFLKGPRRPAARVERGWRRGEWRRRRGGLPCRSCGHRTSGGDDERPT